MKVNVIGELSQEELNHYIKYAQEKEPNCTSVDIIVNGEFIDFKYYFNEPFQRIRRITGYLVGTVDRFNNAKREEVNHRVKHLMGVDFNEEE